METSEFTELYNGNLFFSAENTISFKESDKSAFTQAVTLTYQGAHFDYCTEEIWKAGGDLYSKKSSELQLRKRCDGFVLCRKGKKNYLIWVEMKSSFTEIFEKAIYQFSACYIKMKSYLRTITTYNPGDYEEVAIVISKPEADYINRQEENDIVLSRRVAFVSEVEPAVDRCRRRFRKTGMITIEASDFDADKLHIVPDILPKSLRVIHCPTTSSVLSVDLSKVL